MTDECARADHDGCPDVDDEADLFCTCYCHDEDDVVNDWPPTAYYYPDTPPEGYSPVKREMNPQ